jgi:hypothetical protein
MQVTERQVPSYAFNTATDRARPKSTPGSNAPRRSSSPEPGKRRSGALVCCVRPSAPRPEKPGGGMTFLELCRAAELKSGLVSSQNLMTTTCRPGRASPRKIVTAVADAWNTIQTGRTDWAWMRAAFNGALVIGQGSYTPAQVGIARASAPSFPTARQSECYRPHTIYDPAIGAATRPRCARSAPSSGARSTTAAPDQQPPGSLRARRGNLLVGPLPDKAYDPRALHEVGAGARRRRRRARAPGHFHDIIKWRAILDLHGQDGPLPTARRPGRIFAALPPSRQRADRAGRLGGTLA